VLEVDDQDDECDDFAAHAKSPEGPGAADVPHQEAEVLAEEAGDEGEREKDGGDECELFRDLVLAIGRQREVNVQRAVHQIARRVELVDDPDRVVVNVAVLHHFLGGEQGQIAANDGS
jgi:hypothetical protein